MQPRNVIIGHSWIDEGLNIQTKQVAFALSKSTQVYFLTQSRIRQPLPDNSNLIVLEWPNKRPTKLKDFLFAIKLVRAVRPDLIIVHFASTKALIFAGWLFGVKYRVAWYHTLYEQTKLEAPNRWRALFDVWVRTFTYKMATHVITQAQFAAGDAIRHQHVHPNKIRNIPNGMLAPVERRLSYQYAAPVCTFLYVGRITHSKGCDLLIPVLSKLVDAGHHVALRFVGKGDGETALQTQIATAGLTTVVEMTGLAKSYSEVYTNMQAAYALVVPSRIDNYPTVIIEAMACGVPVIGSNAGGIPYMIEDGVDGYVFSDEQDLLQKMEFLINHPEVRNAMAANARASFEKKYAIERHVDKVMAFIGSLP